MLGARLFQGNADAGATPVQAQCNANLEQRYPSAKPIRCNANPIARQFQGNADTDATPIQSQGYSKATLIQTQRQSNRKATQRQSQRNASPMQRQSNATPSQSQRNANPTQRSHNAKPIQSIAITISKHRHRYHNPNATLVQRNANYNATLVNTMPSNATPFQSQCNANATLSQRNADTHQYAGAEIR